MTSNGLPFYGTNICERTVVVKTSTGLSLHGSLQISSNLELSSYNHNQIFD